MDKDDVKQFLERVERIAQCPVCLEIVSTPVQLCVNGHVACGQCRNGSRNCHMCRRPYSDVSARIIEELLSTLPKPCLHEACDTITSQENHIQYCVYRQMICPLGINLDCGWSGTVKQWLNHTGLNHAKTTYQFNVIECLHFRDFLTEWVSRRYYHQVGEEHFISHIWKEGTKVYHTFRHVACDKPKFAYFFIVTYKCGARVLYKSLIEALPLKEDVPEQSNAALYMADDLNSIVDGTGRLSVFVEAVRKPL